MDQKTKFEWTRGEGFSLFTAMVALFGLVIGGLYWVETKITATRNEMQESVQRTENRIIEEIKENKAVTNKRLDQIEVMRLK